MKLPRLTESVTPWHACSEFRPELSERATSTRLPSLWMHIWVENNFKFWADSRQLPKMLRGKFWHFWWSRFMTLRCWEALDSLCLSLARPGLGSDPGVMASPVSSESLPSCHPWPGRAVSVSAGSPDYTGHVNCEQSQASREPWVFFTGKQQSIWAVITLIHNLRVKCSWKLYQYGRFGGRNALLLWHQNKVKKIILTWI